MKKCSLSSLRESFMTILSARGHTPAYIARGAGIGLFISFTPTVGFQIPILVGLRLLAKRTWPFHLPLALLTTLPTNALTIPFAYYVYVVTGRLMLGRTENLRGFDFFLDRLNQSTASNLTWYEELWQSAYVLLAEFGMPLFIGSLPWALLISMVGYRFTLQLAMRRKGYVE